MSTTSSLPPPATPTSPITATTTTSSYFSSLKPWNTAHRIHKFSRPSKRKAQITITSSENHIYNLAARSFRKPALELRLGAQRDGPCLGYLHFAESHNNFRIHSLQQQQQQQQPPASGSSSKSHPAVQPAEHHAQVRARVGYPHPSAFSFSLPATNGGKNAVDVVWKIRAGRALTPGSVEYDLVVEATNASLATLSRDKSGAVLRWDFEPSSEEEEVFVLLAAVGVLARMDMKGKGSLDDWPSLANRWGIGWYYAVLGTLAVGA